MRATLLDGFQARLEASLAKAGLAMPWWVATVATATGALCAVAAAGQRAGKMPLALLLIATVLALVSILVFAATGQVVRPWQKSIAVLAAAMILLAHPVVPDFAPVPLVVLAADVAVTAHPALSITVAAIGIAEIGASAWWAGLIGFPVYAVAVLLGLAGGSTMRWYIRALESGVSAFVAKNAPTAEILAAIRHASVAPASFTASGLALALARRRRAQDRAALSPREQQVLSLLGQGFSIPRIARALYVSPSTAKTYVARLYEKLGASNRTQALMTALREGLLDHSATMPA